MSQRGDNDESQHDEEPLQNEDNNQEQGDDNVQSVPQKKPVNF